ncbi:MAG: tyrosine-type recombinase/integrase [Planctomycetota bacterium]
MLTGCTAIQPRFCCSAAVDSKAVKRRAEAAGLPQRICCHTFWATTITNLLDQGVPLEDIQDLAGHADPRTTRLYDRRKRQVTRNIVEQISI